MGLVDLGRLERAVDLLGREIDHPARAEQAAGHENSERALDIDPEGRGGARLRGDDADDRRAMHHRLGAMGETGLGEMRPFGDVAGKEGDPRKACPVPGEGGAVAAVESEHLIAAGGQRRADGGADEAGATGDQNACHDRASSVPEGNLRH